MYQYQGLEDTIAAIATAQGAGGIGIVRLSGKDAIAIADKMFKSKSGKALSEAKSHTIHYGHIHDTGHKTQDTCSRQQTIDNRQNDEQPTTYHLPLTTVVVDEVLVSIMKGPKSYTCDDVIEINCHGGSVAAKAVLQVALDAGARLAEPGEFTKRAFVNGRIDLTQAEAVLDIINAKTDNFLRVSTHQLKGELATQLEAIRDELIMLYTEVEAIINFPEDEIDAQNRQALFKKLENQLNTVTNLLASSNNGRLLKEGIRLVLCGKPNVGKSSLLNVLLKQERAIVTDIEGTTRDVLEESAQINGIPFNVVDTAGILEPRDLVEEEAIKRSHLYIKSADLILLVLDQSRDLEKQDQDLLESLKGQNVLVVINKTDLDSCWDEGKIKDILGDIKIIAISAIAKSGIKELENAIVTSVWDAKQSDDNGLMISNMRHVQSLEKANDALANASKIMQENVSWEFISEEIKLAINCLDAITGRNIDQDLLDTIFSSFCIGK